jgi:uncharacterized protein (DUF885 family)
MIRLSFLLALLAAGLAPAQSVDAFFRETFEQMLRDNPEMATTIGRHDYDDRWTDWSQAARDRSRQFVEQRLQMLSRFPLSSLSPENQLNARLVEYEFRSQLESDDLETHLLRVNQLFGFHNRVFLLIDRMPAHTIHDYENILARIKAIPIYVDQNIGILNGSIASRMMQPRVVADIITQQLAAQMDQDSQHTALLAAFRRFPSNIPEAEQKRLISDAVAAYDHQFLPAWRKLHDYMATTYAQHVRSSDSLISIPGGRVDYAILVRRLTTTNMKPEEIHALGEREVKRIESEMQTLIAGTGFHGTIAEFQQNLASSPEQHFHNKEEMLAYCRNIAKIIEPELPNQFGDIPKLLYGVRAIPPDREKATATNAQFPSPDFTTPGWFNLNTYEPGKQVKYDKEALVLHEAVPGHIFQGSLMVSRQGVPDIRKFYFNSAYTEGWGLYAESLGQQLGVYRDVYSRFGQLASERFRAVRLVVDTGIHQLGWTRQQALDYFHDHAPAQSAAEIDRYIAWPAQALSYKIGQLRISELRAQAERRLGPKFDIRQFHDFILGEGILPLELLTEQTNQFIARAAAR